jgi:hypothetical protein
LNFSTIFTLGFHSLARLDFIVKALDGKGVFVTSFSARIIYLGLLLFPSLAISKINIDIEYSRGGSDCKFERISGPVTGDIGEVGKLDIVSGFEDPRDGGLSLLNNGQIVAPSFSPDKNFFFQYSDGGRLLLDLGRIAKIIRINTYSQNRFDRGNQVYVVYSSDGTSKNFNAKPARRIDPEKAGWKRVAQVDTCSFGKNKSWLCGVSISDSDGSLGKFRYLFFDISASENKDAFGNTFFSEMDVVDAADNTKPAEVGWKHKDSSPRKTIDLETRHGKLHLIFDAYAAPDLADWLQNDMAPFVMDWYPRLVDLFNGYEFQSPDMVMIKLVPGIQGTTMNGTSISGMVGGKDLYQGQINLSIDSLRRSHLQSGRGLLVHELTHVVQHYTQWQYKMGALAMKNVPPWLAEGIADYTRIYLFEPESGFENPSNEDVPGARYDAGYRASAKFLHWVEEKYDKKIMLHMNSALRNGTYADSTWNLFTGKSLRSLGDEWMDENEKTLHTDHENFYLGKDLKEMDKSLNELKKIRNDN